MRNLDKMDPLDRMLSRLPIEQSADDLPLRATRYVRSRRHRRLYVRFGLSLALAVGGLWLSSPLVFTLPASMHLPGSGAAMLWAWLQAAFSDVRVFLASAWDGFSGLQSGVAEPMTASVFLGLASLAVSALLAAGSLLPQDIGLTHEGA